MSALLFIVRRSIANAIKGLVKKPGLLVVYCFVALMFVGMILMVFLMPKAVLNHGDPRLFRSIISGLAIVVYYLSFRQGIERGGSMFRLSDVNLVFAGPIRPSDALLYGFIKQMGSVLLVLFVAVFQIPNLNNNFAMQSYGVWVVLLSVGMFALTYPLFGMAIYAYTSKSRARRRAVMGILNALFAVVLALLVYNVWQAGDFKAGAFAVLDSPTFAWVPLVGWMRSIAAAAVDGFNPQFWWGLGLMVACVALFILGLYRLNLDYYEEVLAATEYREAALAAKKEGKSMSFGAKARRKVTSGLTGEGASALFGKNMLELKKSSFVLFFDRTSLIVIASGILFKFIMPKEVTGWGMFLVLGFSTYMLFLLQMQGRWPAELGRPFIFTLPAKPSQKLFWVTASDHIKNALDGAALFVTAGIVCTVTKVYDSFPIALFLLCTVCYTLLGALFTYADVMARRLFGGVHSKPLTVFLKLFLVVFILTPGVVGAIIAGNIVASGLSAEIISVAVLAVWSGLAAGGVFAVSSGIFKNIEAGA